MPLCFSALPLPCFYLLSQLFWAPASSLTIAVKTVHLLSWVSSTHKIYLPFFSKNIYINSSYVLYPPSLTNPNTLHVGFPVLFVGLFHRFWLPFLCIRCLPENWCSSVVEKDVTVRIHQCLCFRSRVERNAAVRRRRSSLHSSFRPRRRRFGHLLGDWCINLLCLASRRLLQS